MSRATAARRRNRKPDLAEYEPRGACADLLRCHAPEVLISGPAGTGKTLACLWKLHTCAVKVPRFRGLVTRKTRHSLTQSVLVTFERYVLPPDWPVLAGATRANREAYHYPNGSEIALGGMDLASRVMSSEYDVIYVPEATELSEEEWEALTTRLRNHVLPFQQLCADCNPDKPGHWLKRRCDAGRCLMLESRHDDNPTVTAEYLAVLDALTGPRKERLRFGRWAQAEGLVYGEWDAARHVVQPFPVPPSWPRYWAVDFGFTNPFCWQEWAQDPDGRLYLVREVYHAGRLVEDHARRIKELTKDSPRPRAVVCDHDAEDRATLERHLQIRTTPAPKEVSPGIQAVASRLRPAGDGRPRLFLVRGCLDERDPSLDARKAPCSTAEEVDGYCFVAGTLIRTAVGEVPIEDVRLDDMVWTREGLRPVRRADLTRWAKVWTVRLSNGDSLTGTADHPIFVKDKGWVSLSSLSYGDTMEEWNPQPLFSTVSLTGVTPNPRTGQREITSAPSRQTVRVASAPSTLICGSPSTEKSRTGATSTTRTATRSTTPSTTCNASPPANTSTPTAETRCDVRPNGSPSWTPPANSPPSGQAPRKAERLPGSGASGSGQGASPRNGCASSAGGYSSVATPASPGSVPVRVTGVTEEPRPAAVYNLTVDGVPEYYANGVLVHNCWDTRAGRKKGESPLDRDDHGLDALRYLVLYLDGKPRSVVPPPMSPTAGLNIIDRTRRGGSLGYGAP